MNNKQSGDWSPSKIVALRENDVSYAAIMRKVVEMRQHQEYDFFCYQKTQSTQNKKDKVVKSV